MRSADPSHGRPDHLPPPPHHPIARCDLPTFSNLPVLGGAVRGGVMAGGLPADAQPADRLCPVHGRLTPATFSLSKRDYMRVILSLIPKLSFMNFFLS